MILAALLPLMGPIIDKLTGLIPDPEAQAKAKAEALQQFLDAAQKADQAQIDVNKTEAQNSSIFVAGWRPFIGWVCGLGCAWNWIGLPIGMFIASLFGVSMGISQADLTEMFPLLLGMLGLGGLRTYEKVQGVSRESMPKKIN